MRVVVLVVSLVATATSYLAITAPAQARYAIVCEGGAVAADVSPFFVDCNNQLDVIRILRGGEHWVRESREGDHAIGICDDARTNAISVPAEAWQEEIAYGLIELCNHALLSLPNEVDPTYETYPLNRDAYDTFEADIAPALEPVQISEQCGFTMYRVWREDGRRQEPIGQGTIRSHLGKVLVEGHWLTRGKAGSTPLMGELTLSQDGRLSGQMSIFFLFANPEIPGDSPTPVTIDIDVPVSPSLESARLQFGIDEQFEARIATWACKSENTTPAPATALAFLVGAWSYDLAWCGSFGQSEFKIDGDQLLYRGNTSDFEPLAYSVVTRQAVHRPTGVRLRPGDIVLPATRQVLRPQANSDRIGIGLSYTDPSLNSAVSSVRLGLLRADGLMIADGRGMSASFAPIEMQRCPGVAR